MVRAAARAADAQRAEGGVLGPLHGLPIPVKCKNAPNDDPANKSLNLLY
jgi:Asp-tRNA(Asn)/Glu-tRNA(Gln) amidotransferase A subunit family amidase